MVINSIMKKKIKNSIKTSIFVKMLSMMLAFIVFILIAGIFSFKTMLEKTIYNKSNDAINNCISLFYLEDDMSLDEYISNLPNDYQVAYFSLSDDYEIDILASNKEINLSKQVQSKIWSSLKVESNYFEFLSNKHSCFATTVIKNDNTYNLLIVLNISKEINYFFQFILIFIAISLAVSTVFGLLTLIWTKKIILPINQASDSLEEIQRQNYNIQLKKSNYLEIQRLNLAIEGLIANLNESNNLDKDILANISHEFKTPLTLIKSYAEMIIDFSGDDKELRESHLNTIISESDHLTSLVNDVLSLSRAEARVEARITRFNFTELIRSTINSFDALISKENIELKLDLINDVYMEANYKQICEVVYNLISNAIHYAKTKIEIRLFNNKGIYRFEVSDDGPGIAKEDLDSIWNKYYRGKNKPTMTVKGTGLGLALVKEVLTAHNYPFGVVTLPNKGATFYFEFKKDKI